MQVVAAHPDMAVAEVASMHIGLARFAEAVFADQVSHFDGVLGACARVQRLLVQHLALPHVPGFPTLTHLRALEETLLLPTIMAKLHRVRDSVQAQRSKI